MINEMKDQNIVVKPSLDLNSHDTKINISIQDSLSRSSSSYFLSFAPSDEDSDVRASR
jgi:hypothetical protein